MNKLIKRAVVTALSGVLAVSLLPAIPASGGKEKAVCK